MVAYNHRVYQWMVWDQGLCINSQFSRVKGLKLNFRVQRCGGDFKVYRVVPLNFLERNFTVPEC